MKFSTTREKILNSILIAERIVGKKESLPVLSCLLLDAHSVFTIQATNLEASVDIQVMGEVVERGRIAVPATILSQTIRAVSGDKISLRTENENLLIESRGSRTLIKAISHSEFPVLNDGTKKTTKKTTINRTALLNTFQAVSYAASSSMIRPELGSVFLSLTDGVMTCVATDSFRLAEKVVANSFSDGGGEVLVPLKHTHEVIHCLDKIDSDNITLSIDDAQLILSTNTFTYTSRIVDGAFPNYKEIIPKKYTTEATLLKEDFADALRKARVFSGSDQHVGFHVYPKKKVFDVTAQSAAVGEMSDSIDAALSGDDIDVNFHIGYVADCLQSIESDSITLGFAGYGKPVVIRGVSDPTFTYIAMPLNR